MEVEDTTIIGKTAAEELLALDAGRLAMSRIGDIVIQLSMDCGGPCTHVRSSPAPC